MRNCQRIFRVPGLKPSDSCFTGSFPFQKPSSLTLLAIGGFLSPVLTDDIAIQRT